MPDLLMQISPAWALICAGAICALTPSHAARKVVTLLGPVVAFLLFMTPSALGETGGAIRTAGVLLTTWRLDGLSWPFALVFILAAFLTAIYGFGMRDRAQDAAIPIYAGAALGAVLAGDLLTLFVFWELATLASVLLVWRRDSTAARAAGMRYLGMQVLSGALLLSGAALRWAETGSMTFEAIGLHDAAGWLILIGFGIKCGFPLLHAWIPDAYPQSTVVGGVALCAFTTKMALYALARGFAGEEALVWIGAAMALTPVFMAVVADDLRRVLSYALISQMGFMVAGVGVGSALALNGVAAHAFVSTIYTTLLFMAVGAVLHSAGTARASQLGGLFRTMPLSAAFCAIGAASIAALPLFSGFVAKSMILSALALEGHGAVWLALVCASAAVLAHAGLRLPLAAFFARDCGRRPAEAPFPMLLAMALAAALCVATAFPWGGYQWLYGLMPFAAEYAPYEWGHVLGQLQLLFGAGAAFVTLRLTGLFPRERTRALLDIDWLYRRPLLTAAQWSVVMAGRFGAHGRALRRRVTSVLGRRIEDAFAPAGTLTRGLPMGALWTAALLAVALLVVYLA